MRIVSLFSGIGGFELGINNSNLDGEFVFSSEIDIHAATSYLSNYKNNNLHGDITKINEKDIPNHELLVGGFPCQAFSIAGRQKGFNDTRGTLFFDVARILKEKKPKYLLLENVKNLVSHDEGKTFKIIINTLNELGYTIDFSIINSVEAGLPQNRERTYIVGILSGKTTNIKYDRRNKKINELKHIINYNGFDFFNSLKFSNTQKYIKDILEETKSIKYLINNERVEKFLQTNNFNERKEYTNKIIKLFDLPKEVWNEKSIFNIRNISYNTSKIRYY